MLLQRYLQCLIFFPLLVSVDSSSCLLIPFFVDDFFADNFMDDSFADSFMDDFLADNFIFKGVLVIPESTSNFGGVSKQSSILLFKYSIFFEKLWATSSRKDLLFLVDAFCMGVLDSSTIESSICDLISIGVSDTKWSLIDSLCLFEDRLAFAADFLIEEGWGITLGEKTGVTGEDSVSFNWNDTLALLAIEEDRLVTIDRPELRTSSISEEEFNFKVLLVLFKLSLISVTSPRTSEVLASDFCSKLGFFFWILPVDKAVFFCFGVFKGVLKTKLSLSFEVTEVDRSMLLELGEGICDLGRRVVI